MRRKSVPSRQACSQHHGCSALTLSCDCQTKLTEYLIRWKGYGAAHDFWQDDTENMPDKVKACQDEKESAERLHVCCPNMD